MSYGPITGLVLGLRGVPCAIRCPRILTLDPGRWATGPLGLSFIFEYWPVFVVIPHHLLLLYVQQNIVSKYVLNLYSALRNASNALSVQVHSKTDASLASSGNCRHWAMGLGGRQAVHSRPSDRRRRTPDGRACCDDVVVWSNDSWSW